MATVIPVSTPALYVSGIVPPSPVVPARPPILTRNMPRIIPGIDPSVGLASLVRRRALLVPAVAAAATTWNPADTAGANTTLSNGNKTFAPNTTGVVGARATTSRSSGKLVFEITIGASGGVGSSQSGYGLSNSGAGFGSLFVASGCVIALHNGNYNYNVTGNQSGKAPNCTNGATLMFAVDMSNQLWWCMSSANAGQWNTNTTSTANPGTNTGGLAWSGLNAALYPVGFVNSGTGTDASYTINTVGPFVNPVPSGFSAWG